MNDQDVGTLLKQFTDAMQQGQETAATQTAARMPTRKRPIRETGNVMRVDNPGPIMLDTEEKRGKYTEVTAVNLARYTTRPISYIVPIAALNRVVVANFILYGDIDPVVAVPLIDTGKWFTWLYGRMLERMINWRETPMVVNSSLIPQRAGPETTSRYQKRWNRRSRRLLKHLTRAARRLPLYDIEKAFLIRQMEMMVTDPGRVTINDYPARAEYLVKRVNQRDQHLYKVNP